MGNDRNDLGPYNPVLSWYQEKPGNAVGTVAGLAQSSIPQRQETARREEVYDQLTPQNYGTTYYKSIPSPGLGKPLIWVYNESYIALLTCFSFMFQTGAGGGGTLNFEVRLQGDIPFFVSGVVINQAANLTSICFLATNWPQAATVLTGTTPFININGWLPENLELSQGMSICLGRTGYSGTPPVATAVLRNIVLGYRKVGNA